MEKTNKVLVVLLIIALILVGFFGYLANRFFRDTLTSAKIQYMTLRAIEDAGYKLGTKKEYDNLETFKALHGGDIHFDTSKEIYELVKKENKENTEDNMNDKDKDKDKDKE